MEPDDELLFWARVKVCAFLLQLARVMRREANVALAAARRLDPGR